METEQRRGSSKSSKKGGKRIKALTAEEEARRREVVKEKLREKLELERRAVKVVERLLEDRVAEDFLIDCARLISTANYKDAVEERSIAKLCGYPICPNKLGKIPTQQFKISTKTNKVYDITERKCFCSNFCYKASKQFELQISKTPLWLRQHESPSEIKLMKKGDGGSSGEEVMLTERRLQEDEIENPLAAPTEGPHTSQQHPHAADLNHSDGSDIEQEQDFVSSVVSQRQGPRVHWGHMPKRTDPDGEEDEEEEVRRRKTERQEKRRLHVEKEGQIRKDESERKSHRSETEGDPEKPKTDIVNAEQVAEGQSWQEGSTVEEATEKMNLCSLSAAILPSAPTQAENTHHPDSAADKEGEDLSTGSKQSSSLTERLTDQPGLNITQVGVSKRGAVGLRNLLKNHTAAAKPESIRLNLLECLRKTLQEWSTRETLTFLYGADHSLHAPYADVKEAEEEEEEEAEELDEDDVDGEDGEEVQRLSAPIPDYESLRKESQEMELRVREFYKGAESIQDDMKEKRRGLSRKDPALPLIDSQAQHLIQKRITVEKLNSCLRNIVGPLHLTMTDVSTDLNNLIRTFRFTNTNIIHKTPEWTLIAVVLLHLLSEVSQVIHEALEKPASAVYLNTLMKELGLQQQDLLNLVQMFKTPAH